MYSISDIFFAFMEMDFLVFWKHVFMLIGLLMCISFCVYIWRQLIPTDDDIVFNISDHSEMANDPIPERFRVFEAPGVLQSPNLLLINRLDRTAYQTAMENILLTQDPFHVPCDSCEQNGCDCFRFDPVDWVDFSSTISTTTNRSATPEP